MPVWNSQQLANLMTPELHRVYIQVGKERPLEYPLFFNVSTMPTNPLKDREVSGIGTLPEMPAGEQFPRDTIYVGNTTEYTAVPYGLGIEINFETWEDELYGVIKTMVGELARASRNRMEIDAWSILNNAFDTSYTGFDGTCLCSTSHEKLGGGTAANRPSPDASLSMTALQAALLRMENLTNDQGMPMLLTPSRLVVAPANKYTAMEILGSGHKPYTADNEINVLQQEDLAIFVCHYLTNSNYWFLATGKGSHDLNFYIRTQPIFRTFGDPYSLNIIAAVYQRHAAGFGSWRGIDGSTG